MKKLLTKILLIFTITLSLSLNFSASQASAVDWGDFFQSSDSSEITFTDYQGSLAELEAEGYDEALTTANDIKTFVKRIVNFALGFLGFIAVIVIIYAGVLYVTAADSDRTETAKKAIQYAVIGLLIVMASMAIVNTVIRGATGTDSSTGTSQSGITGAITSAGFNSSAEEVRTLAKNVYTGFASLSEITEEFRGIQDDAMKSSLDPKRLPNKNDILSFLSSVRAKLNTVENKTQNYTETYILINNLSRELDNQIDMIKTINEKAYIRLNNEGDMEICNEDPDESFTEALGNAVFGVESCSDEGFYYYYKNLYPFWGQEGYTAYSEYQYADLVGLNLREAWVEGKYLEPVLNAIKNDYIESLSGNFERLQKLNLEYSGFDGLEEADGYYEDMAESYGFESLEDYSNGMSITAIAKDNFFGQILGWSLDTENGDVIPVANSYLEEALTNQSGYYEELRNLQYVEARLSANTIEGSAPLTVIFDALATNDPAGGSLQKGNIIWDLSGKYTEEELLSSNEYGQLIESEDGTMICDLENIVADSSEEAEYEEKLGKTSQRCTYMTPGTYKAAIKIKSNDDSQFAPGISILTVTVTPPNTKIDLEMNVKGSDPVTIIRYNDDDTMEVNKTSVSVTLDQASAGITFDASDTYAEMYKWSFGNGDVRDYTNSPTETAYFSEVGKYEVVLEVVSALNVVDRKVFTLEVSDLSARIIDENSGESMVNTKANFDASQSRSDSGQIRTYKWTVTPEKGQVIPDDLENPYEIEAKDLEDFSYEFKYPLIYDIELTITDENGKKASDVVENFKVTSQKPVAQFTVEQKSTSQPATYTFYGDKSFDPDGEEGFLKYSWEISGTEDQDYKYQENTDANSKNPVVKFLEKGKYEVSLTVKDYLTSGGNEEKDLATKTIDVSDTLDIKWGENANVTAIIEDQAEEGISLPLISDNAIAYEVDYGDGSIETGEFDVQETLRHIYSQAGKYEVSVTVFNAEDEDKTIERNVFIGDGDNPVAKIKVFVNDTEIYDLSSPIKVSKKDVVRVSGEESKNTDGTGRKLLYSWDFGDQSLASTKEASHIYKELSPKDIGYYTIKLKVADKDNTSAWAEDEIKINVENMAPSFSSIQAVPRLQRDSNETPITVLMKAYGAEDQDGSITQYRWWYYDLREPDTQLGIQISTQNTSQLIIGTNGKEGEEIEYGFALEVYDNDNLTYSSRDLYANGGVPTLTVINGPNELPEAEFSVNVTKAFIGEEITFTSKSTDSDGEILKYIWDFEGDGFYNNSPTDQNTVVKVYDTANLNGYEVRLKVIDDKGGEAVSAPFKLFIEQSAKAPVAAFTYEAKSGTEGKAIKFTNNSEADEEAAAEIIKNAWDFDIETDSDGDGITENDEDSLEENPEFLYSSHGLYKVKLTVTDSQGNVGEVVNDVLVGTLADLEEPSEYGDLGEFLNEDGVIDSGGLGDTDSSLELTEDKVLAEIKAVLMTTPYSEEENLVILEGDSAQVKLDFSQSEGEIKYFVVDKNIYYDTDGDGQSDNDWDYVTDKRGSYTSNFAKSWGDIAVKLLVIDAYSQEDEQTRKIIFK